MVTVIDFHAHQPTETNTWGLGAAYTAVDYLRSMDTLGISHTALFTLDGLMDFRPDRNDALASYVAGTGGRLIPFATVGPRRDDAPLELERCFQELGMKGLKLHPWLQGFCPHEAFLDPLCEVAARYTRPVVFHDGTPPYSTPLQIAVLARRHPNLVVVLGHGGLRDLWREAIEAVAETGNLHICMCGASVHAMREIVRRCPLERILFGTDAGIASSAVQPYVRARVLMLQSVGLSPEQMSAICEINPRRLLGLTMSA